LRKEREEMVEVSKRTGHCQRDGEREEEGEEEKIARKGSCKREEAGGDTSTLLAAA
jgi:hypothetical protein